MASRATSTKGNKIIQHLQALNPPSLAYFPTPVSGADACLTFTNTSIQYSNECLLQLWKMVGCTTTTLPERYVGNMTMRTVEYILNDMTAWASSSLDFYRGACYSECMTGKLYMLIIAPTWHETYIGNTSTHAKHLTTISIIRTIACCSYFMGWAGGAMGATTLRLPIANSHWVVPTAQPRRI